MNDAGPPFERWDDWVEFDAARWPQRVERHYTLAPTLCPACGGGVLAYVEHERLRVRKFEPNPLCPTEIRCQCAVGRALVNFANDPDRLRYPLRRVGGRGDGFWETVTWDEALDAVAAKLRESLTAPDAKPSILHADRSTAFDGVVDLASRIGLDLWSDDSALTDANARLGLALWTGDDDLTPDLTDATLILVIGSPLDESTLANAAARRLVAAKSAGARVVAVAPVVSRLVGLANDWLAAWPGSEGAALLAVAATLINLDLVDWDYVEANTNWPAALAAWAPDAEPTFAMFQAKTREQHASFTPEFAQGESGVDAGRWQRLARDIGAAGRGFRVWLAGDVVGGNLGGWQTARNALWLATLVGAAPPPRATLKADASPALEANARPSAHWNDALWSMAYPLAAAPTTYLTPRRVVAGQPIGAYLSINANPVWRHPDAFAWVHLLRDEAQVGLHVALTPFWHETAWYADFVLPIGTAGEAHALHFGEPDADWRVRLAQPVVEVVAARLGRAGEELAAAPPHAIWDPAQVWIELLWRIDSTGELGIRRIVESARQPGAKMTVAERYETWLAVQSPELADVASANGEGPLEYLRRRGVFAPAVARDPLAPPADSPVVANAATNVDAAAAPGNVAPEAPISEVALTEQRLVEQPVADVDKGGVTAGHEAESGTSSTVDLVPSTADEPDNDVIHGAEAEPQCMVPAPVDLAETTLTGAPQSTGVDESAALIAPMLLAPTSTIEVAEPEPKSAESLDGAAAQSSAPPMVWPTPSGKLEIYSATLGDWGWPEAAAPSYTRGQVGKHMVNRQRGEFALIPTPAPPPLPGAEFGSAKWLLAIAHSHPLWLHPADADKLGLRTGELTRVRTEIGHFVTRIWVSEGVPPGIVAITRGFGRWRRQAGLGVSAWASSLVEWRGPGYRVGGADGSSDGVTPARWSVRLLHGVEPFESRDADSARLPWRDAGVPFNLAFPVHPDPVSGQHVWNQKVVVERAKPDDRYGDIEVDPRRADLVARDWTALTRPGPGPDRARRPRWLPRPYPPVESAWVAPEPAVIEPEPVDYPIADAAEATREVIAEPSSDGLGRPADIAGATDAWPEAPAASPNGGAPEIPVVTKPAPVDIDVTAGSP